MRSDSAVPACGAAPAPETPHDPARELLQHEAELLGDALRAAASLTPADRELLWARLARLERQAAAMSRARQDFLAVVSHELRTPLTSILGFLEIVLSGAIADPAEVRRCLEDTLQSAHELHRVVNDILDLAEFEAGRAEIQVEPVDVMSILREEVARHGDTATARGIELRIEAAPDTGLAAMADPVRLRTVVRHLLSNAVKFTPAGSIRVGACFTGVHTRAVRVDVRDTGIGFAPELAGILSQAFLQAEDAMTRTRGGMGLGLSLAARLLRAMDGRLEIHSDGPGTGTLASFTLPAATEMEELATTPRAS